MVTHFFVARRMARRFVAGETLDEGLAAAREMNEKGLMVSLDLLGESVHDEVTAISATDAYVNLLQAIHKNTLDANISVKPTQLGLDISEQLCADNLRRMLTTAQECGTSVNIDMESSKYTDATIKIFRQLSQEFDNVSTVIQSYLRRSEADMTHLADEGSTVRLCKGAYKEPPDVAFPEKVDVDANYVKLMQAYMADDNRQKGAYLKVATHDPNMIDATLQYVKEHNIPVDQFEFQMLYGIRTKTQFELHEQGYQMRVYIPYGTEWYPYFMRRLAERPANLWFLLKNVFTR
jgi:proline dehydrogenase